MSRETSKVIPDFLTAGSPQGLRRLMRLNNAKRGCWHKYDIQFVQGKWFAWYYPAVETAQEKAEGINEIQSIIDAERVNE